MFASAPSSSIDRQLERVVVARVFADKASGKETQRPELERLLAFVFADGNPHALSNEALAEFERIQLRERQREGVTLAKRRGVYRGRKRALNDERISDMKRRIADGEEKAQMARDMGINRAFESSQAPEY